jgi:hypothetical protein
MGYFDFLPNIAYPNYEGGNVIVKNIVTRAKVLDSVREAQSAALEYTIEDGEKPETLAYRVYGRSDYHWLILLFNEVHDPYFGWPMSMDELARHMEASYTGKALFIDPTMMLDSDRAQSFDRRRKHLQEGDLIEQRNNLGAVVATATVQSFDPNLYKVVVDVVSGSFRLQGEAARFSSVIADRSLLTRDLTTVTTEGLTVAFPLVRITDDNRYALNRFENADEETISPWFAPSGNPSPLIDRYVLGREESIPMGDDAGGEDLGNATIVTNIVHEERINDGKRTIRVMRPEYIDLVLRDLRRLF